MNGDASPAMATQLTAHPSMTDIRSADTPLEAVLQGKPTTDEVPLAVWWLVAESLRHSVLVRRAVEGVALLASAELSLEIDQARLASDAALQDLGVESIGRAGSGARRTTAGGTPMIPTLRTTIHNLARLIVRARPTSRSDLRAAIIGHLEALHAADRHRPKAVKDHYLNAGPLVTK